jgi:hypothetical protein
VRDVQRWRAVIFVYGDDGADEKNKRVCAVAGVVRTILGWKALEREWLVRTGGIPFHADECKSDLGAYKEFTQQENKELYKVTPLASSLAILTTNFKYLFTSSETTGSFVPISKFSPVFSKKCLSTMPARCTRRFRR